MMLQGIAHALRLDEVSRAARTLDRAEATISKSAVSAGLSQRSRSLAMERISTTLADVQPVVDAHGAGGIGAALLDARGMLADVRSLPNLGSKPIGELVGVAGAIEASQTWLGYVRRGTATPDMSAAVLEAHGLTGYGDTPQVVRDARMGAALLARAETGIVSGPDFGTVIGIAAPRFAGLAATDPALASAVDAARASATGTPGERVRALSALRTAAGIAIGDHPSPAVASLAGASKLASAAAAEVPGRLLSRASAIDDVDGRLAAAKTELSAATGARAALLQTHVDALELARLGAISGDLSDRVTPTIELLRTVGRDGDAAALPSAVEAVERLLRSTSGRPVSAPSRAAHVEIVDIAVNSLRESAVALQSSGKAVDPALLRRIDTLRADVAPAADGDFPMRFGRVLAAGLGSRVVQDESNIAQVLDASLIHVVDRVRESSPTVADSLDESLAKLVSLRREPVASTWIDWFGTRLQDTWTAAHATPAGDAAAAAADGVATAAVHAIPGERLAPINPLVQRVRDGRADLENVLESTRQASDTLVRGPHSKLQANGARRDLTAAIERLEGLATELEAAGAPTAGRELRVVTVRMRRIETELVRYGKNVTSEAKVIDHGNAGRRLADLDYVEMLADMELANAARGSEAGLAVI